MESWVLEGDSYSFLRSAPRNFNLRQREGPNRVEIFDITSIPSSRSEISETTCLCDIFGDDCESPSLSSSPASTSFLKKEVETHLPVEDVNDSSGSYHTAHSSEQLSDTSDSFEDSRDSLKQATKESLLPKTRESIPAPTDLNSLNNKTVDTYENHSTLPSPSNKVDDGNLSQTESQNEPILAQNIDESAQCLALLTSDVRDNTNNCRVTDSSETSETITPELNPLNSSDIKAIYTEQTEISSSDCEDFSTPPIPHQPESPILENQDHPLTYGPLDKFSQEIKEITPYSEASAEEDNVFTNPEENESNISSLDTRGSCISTIKDVPEVQEEGQSNETGLTNLDRLENSDLTPVEICHLTPDSSSPSMRALTPDTSLTPPLAQMDTNFDSKFDATLEKNDLAISSPETINRHQSAPLTDDKAPEALQEQPSQTPSTPAAEDDTEINVSSFEYQRPMVSPEALEMVVSPDPRRLSFISDTTESLASPEVSEFRSFSGCSSMAAHSTEPSIVIYSPVGYTISPSPEFERRGFASEPETISSTPEMIHQETDYSVTPRDFQGSVSSVDSKLCLTPESRSLTSTPEISQEFLTPDSMPTAFSPELRSATSPRTSPEVKTMACSILSPNPPSPQIQEITYRVVSPQNQVLVLPQYSEVEEMRFTESSLTHPAVDMSNLARDSPSTSKHQNASPTPENMSRASSTTLSLSRDATSSPEIRVQHSPDRFIDEIFVPDVCTPLEPNIEEVDLPSLVPDDLCLHSIQEEPDKSCSPALDECKDFAYENTEEILVTEAFGEPLSTEPPGQKIKDSEAVPSGGDLPVMQVQNVEDSTEKIDNESLSDLITNENARPASMVMLTAPTAEERKILEDNDSRSGRGDMLVRGSGGSGKPPVHVPARPRESPNVFHCGNDREYDRQSCRNKGWSKERVVQGERTSGKGEENLVEGSYREEQVELSFRDRNRKGPASHSAAPSSGDPKSGIPARCYFESPLTTRQQQSHLRAQGVQKENKSSARRVQSGFQSKHSGAGCPPSGYTAETSSMGSEFDEADNEVKWFTDVAFTSLSSPQGGYLDVYSSSHRSSTNVSQPSTVDSPSAATWMSYADLHASAVHENDDLQSHTPPFLPYGTLDPSRHFEISSFECVDVVVENKEESKRGTKRTVPKRQIQLKRRNNEESMSTENTGNVMDSPFLQRRSRDVFIRQHSTPAVGHKDMSHLSEGETEIQADKKMLQKSSSFDETSTKTKMATTIINSVLSKKMETKEPSGSEESSPSEDKKKHPEPLSVEPGVSGNIERHIESSSLLSECSLSSDDYTGREDRSPYLQKKKSCAPKVPPKPIFKPSFIPASLNSGIAALQDRMPGADQMRPRVVDPFKSRTPPKKQIVLNSEKEAETSDLRERSNHDSANTTAKNTTPAATRAANTHNRFANRDSEYCATPETHKQQDCKRMFLSKTSEITLKQCTTKDKTKSSQKVSFSPAHSIDESQLEETPEWQTRVKPDRQVETENEEDEKLNSKPVMHKVRDVRKLVKNTYNLSFKASNTTFPVEGPVDVPQKEKEMQNPHTLHIECKAISTKDKQASDKKDSSMKEETPHPDKLGMEVTTEINIKKNTTDINAKTSLPMVTMESKQRVKTVQVSDVDNKQCITKSKPPENTVHGLDLEVPPRPTSKETSALLFLQDDTSSANSCLQKPGSPAPIHGKSMSNSHSVSMILKEKGMQADIGVCEVLNEGIGAIPKHINRLEVPLQTCVLEGASNDSQKDKKIDEIPCEPKKSVDGTLQGTQCVSLVRGSPKPRELRVSPSGTLTDQTSNQFHTASMQPSREAEKMTTPATLVPNKFSPPLASNKSEIRSFSSNSSNKSNAMPVTTSKEIELPIQVRSVSSDRPKPVPLKPSYKQPFTEMRSMSSDLPKTDIPSMSSIFKQQTHSKSDVKKSETSSVAVAQKEHSTEAASNSIKKLSVSAVSSYKPSIPATGSKNSDSEQKPTGPSVATLARQQVSITSVQNSVTSNQNQLNVTASEDQAGPVSPSSCTSSHPVLPVASQSHTYIQPSKTASSVTSYQLLKDDFHFHESDDPPSYDERESFSPLLLSDLPPRRLNRYHPSNKPSSHPHPGNPYPGPQNRTPPASRASPGQVISYPSAPPKAQVRPHQTRQDCQPLNYPSVSPKIAIPPAPAMIQPLNHSYPCPAPAVQSYSDEQPPSSTQMQMERHTNRRSPQAGSGAAYREHSHSPNMAMDPRSQFFGSHDLPPAFSHDYGSDGPGGSSVLYPENASGLGYGQGPRRVLLDPETGKYFYIEVPVQPLRKMLFDPEIGQYVEVLIPQQAMSHSGMYPPTAAPYPSLHGPGLYAPQYLPYGAPPHPQSAQQPRHPETSVSTSLHQTSMGYGGSAGQTPKSEAKSHPSLDQSYLESMYYIPSGINASPNSTPSDCYHKPSPNIPASSGRRV
ncbi:hypothetical protein AMEX_G13239 [Astyanax mexicanus]|uniref:DUF4585 domain-containing protein n=1 Tax=Astyanax mexicanus TaxID=7994 RepID=A0A8T2LTX9_ASTMX|nr:hypothetical protein AMEX_G13239 [Astyanax mexicanus]